MSKGSDARPRTAEKVPSTREPGRRLEPRQNRTWALSPTDLTFLWDECPQCFYKKVVLRQPRPRSPFPKVFGVIDRAMKAGYLGQRAEGLAPGAPSGVIGSPDRWVKSSPIAVPGCATSLVFRGRLDALVACDDGTDAVTDYKTALPNDAHISLYGRQLHAYTWALERPARGHPDEISALGLLCFSPDGFEADGHRGALVGNVAWIGVPRDDGAFGRFLAEVVQVLDGPEAPPAAPGCAWCERTTALGAVA